RPLHVRSLRMAFAVIREVPPDGYDPSPRNYDAINERLVHAQAPDGLNIHHAGLDEDAGVSRIVKLWETREQGKAYDEDHVMPAVWEVVGEDMGRPSRDTVYELHHVAHPAG